MPTRSITKSSQYCRLSNTICYCHHPLALDRNLSTCDFTRYTSHSFSTLLVTLFPTAKSVREGVNECESLRENNETVHRARFDFGDQVGDYTVRINESTIEYAKDDPDYTDASTSVVESRQDEVEKGDSEFSFHTSPSGIATMRSLPLCDTVSRLRELQQERPPLFFCKLIVAYPKLALGKVHAFLIDEYGMCLSIQCGSR